MTCARCQRTATGDTRPCYCHWLADRRPANGTSIHFPTNHTPQAMIQSYDIHDEPLPDPPHAEPDSRGVLSWLGWLS